jgi:hypothetical protein
LIAIEVTAPSATLADDIAKAWAEVYERQVNNLYGSSAPESLSLEREVGQAKQKYEGAESALTSFLGTVPVGENTRILEYKQRVLRELMAVRQSQLVDLYKIDHRVELLIDQALALQSQLAAAQDNSAAASSATALTLLKTQAFASSIALPSGLQLQLPSRPTGSQPQSGVASTATTDSIPNSIDQSQDTAALSRSLQDWNLAGNLQIQVPATTAVSLAQQRADVASTISALQQWHQRLQEAIQQSGDASGPDATVPANQTEVGQAISQLEAEIRDLQVKVADQTARQRQLQQERDVQWDSYTTILKKAEEGRVASMIGAGKEVTIAGRSVPEPRSRRLGLMLPLAAAVGATLAAAILLLGDYAAPLFDEFRNHSNGRARSAPLPPRPVDVGAAPR